MIGFMEPLALHAHPGIGLPIELPVATLALRKLAGRGDLQLGGGGILAGLDPAQVGVLLIVGRP